MGENVVTGTGTCSPNLACAATPSDVRSCGLASVRVFVIALEQAVVERRQVREDDVGLRQVAQVLQRQVVAVDVGRRR